MTNYAIDPAHSSVGFSIRHMMIAKVNGNFDKFSGTLAYDAANPSASSVNATIETASINTREQKRDEHLKSGDFFDAAKFPTITFKSTSVTGQKGAFTVAGELSLHGVTKPVTLTVDGPTDEMKDPWGNLRVGLSATTKIKRKDFGLEWNAALETGGILVGEEVSITLDLQFVKQA